MALEIQQIPAIGDATTTRSSSIPIPITNSSSTSHLEESALGSIVPPTMEIVYSHPVELENCLQSNDDIITSLSHTVENTLMRQQRESVNTAQRETVESPLYKSQEELRAETGFYIYESPP